MIIPIILSFFLIQITNAYVCEDDGHGCAYKSHDTGKIVCDYLMKPYYDNNYYCFCTKPYPYYSDWYHGTVTELGCLLNEDPWYEPPPPAPFVNNSCDVVGEKCKDNGICATNNIENICYYSNDYTKYCSEENATCLYDYMYDWYGICQNISITGTNLTTLQCVDKCEKEGQVCIMNNDYTFHTVIGKCVIVDNIFMKEPLMLCKTNNYVDIYAPTILYYLIVIVFIAIFNPLTMIYYDPCRINNRCCGSIMIHTYAMLLMFWIAILYYI